MDNSQLRQNLLQGYDQTDSQNAPNQDTNNKNDGDKYEFDLKRSCLSEVKLLRRPNQLSIIGFRKPTEYQLSQSRQIKPLQLESQKQFYKLERQHRNYDFISALLGLFGLVLTIINYEHTIFTYDTDKSINLKMYPISHLHPRVTNNVTTLIRSIVLVTTIISVVFMVKMEKTRIFWMNKYFNDVEL